MDYGRLGPSDLGGSSRLNSLRSSGRKKIVLLSLFAVLLIVVSAVTAVAVRSHTKNTKADGTSLEKFSNGFLFFKFFVIFGIICGWVGMGW